MRSLRWIWVTDRILDVGCGHDPDPRATETADAADLAHVDRQFDVTNRWPVMSQSVDGIIMSHVIEHVRDPIPVLREATRCLVSGGWLEVTVPIGIDAMTDPDHERRWSFETFEIICAEQRQRHWDADTRLRLLDRAVDPYLRRPFSPLTPLVKLLATRWPAEMSVRATGGEMTGWFERV
jgi:SAM-dependent methyltransferase